MHYGTDTNVQNLESTVLPLLSICSMTSNFYKNTPIKSSTLQYSLLDSTAELPEHKTPQLLKLIQECQDCFEKEAHLLLQNDLSNNDIEVLFSRYKQFLVGTYILKSDFYDPNNEINFDSSDKSWIFDNSVSLGDTTCNSSYSNNLREYDIEHASMLLTSDVLEGVSPHNLEFESSELYNDTELFHDDEIFNIDEGLEVINTPVEDPSPPRSLSSYQSKKSENHFVNVKRNRITKETREILEAIYSVKSFPNTAERKLIARKCNLTPTQVRIWFTNTRARRKVKSPSGIL